MSTNLSKQKWDDLLSKISAIRAYIFAAPQDENTGSLLTYLSDLEKDVNVKKYGLVFEEHQEAIDTVLLPLETRKVYAFVLSNAHRIKNDVRQAMAIMLDQQIIKTPSITTVEFHIPQSCLFTYDGTAKSQAEMGKNVYVGYLASAEVRSASEKKFERFCETCDAVDWVYKNGDKGAEYFSIVYMDSFGKQKSFFPDYIISVQGEIWIIETKGSFDRTGKSEDIDIFSPRKFEVLKNYLTKYGLRGGFVREDKQSQELCICMDMYNEDIKGEYWALLDNVMEAVL